MSFTTKQLNPTRRQEQQQQQQQQQQQGQEQEHEEEEEEEEEEEQQQQQQQQQQQTKKTICHCTFNILILIIFFYFSLILRYPKLIVEKENILHLHSMKVMGLHCPIDQLPLPYFGSFVAGFSFLHFSFIYLNYLSNS